MVPDSLNESLRGALAGLRRHAGVMLTALAAGSFSLLLLAWLLMDQGERSIAGDRRPSLLDLLDQVSGERGRQLEDKPVVKPPMAPRSRSWTQSTFLMPRTPPALPPHLRRWNHCALESPLALFWQMCSTRGVLKAHC